MAVSVVGAGISGLSIALHLLERDVRPVTVYERTGIGSGASGIQPGGVRQQWGTRANCLMAKESVAFYRGFAERFHTLARAHFDPCGYVFLADEPETLARLEAGLRVQHDLGIPSRLLTAAEAAEGVPGLEPAGVLGATYRAGDGHLDPPRVGVEDVACAGRRT